MKLLESETLLKKHVMMWTWMTLSLVASAPRGAPQIRGGKRDSTLLRKRCLRARCCEAALEELSVAAISSDIIQLLDAGM